MRPLLPAVIVLSILIATGCASRTRAPEPGAWTPRAAAEEVAVASVAERDTEVSIAPRRSDRPSPKNDPRYALPRGKNRTLSIFLGSQTFEYVEDGEVITSGEVSSGSAAHPTPTGGFRVQSKNKNKRSGSYTNYFDQNTPMPYSLQFHGPYFIHEGWLPGHAASHGCVRLHYEDARFLFDRMRVGDRVLVKHQGRARPANLWDDMFPVF